MRTVGIWNESLPAYRDRFQLPTRAPMSTSVLVSAPCQDQSQERNLPFAHLKPQ